MASERKTREGRPILGAEPDCTCDGDVVTLWDCECRECRALAAEGEEEPEAECRYCGSPSERGELTCGCEASVAMEPSEGVRDGQ